MLIAQLNLVLDALGDGTRRAILEVLRSRPCSVGEIVAAVSISQPAVSQHLKIMREAGILSVRKDGTRRIYGLDPDGLSELRRYVNSFWDDVLGSYKASVEEIGDGVSEKCELAENASPRRIGGKGEPAELKNEAREPPDQMGLGI